MNKQQKTIIPESNTKLEPVNKGARVIAVTPLTDSAFILRLERNGMKFNPGQHMTLGLYKSSQLREYSIYSSNNDEHLEVLIREVENGYLSRELRKLNAGDLIKIDGPFGFFSVDENKKATHKHLFIASGTGIAPFHSMVKSIEGLDYKILHGIRFGEEQYAHEEYPEDRYISCTSKDDKGVFHGRVTDYLKQNDLDSNTLVYLCGNYEMINDVYDILTSKGFSPDNIRTEVYF